MVTAYIIDHRDFAEDCGCAHYIAQAFDGQDHSNQLQPSAPALKMQDYLAVAVPPVPPAPLFAAAPTAGMAPNHYRYRAAVDVFHPPCIPASFFIC